MELEKMCNASKYLIALGEMKGIVKMAIEYNENREVTIRRLMQKFNLSEKEAIKIYEEFCYGC